MPSEPGHETADADALALLELEPVDAKEEPNDEVVVATLPELDTDEGVEELVLDAATLVDKVLFSVVVENAKEGAVADVEDAADEVDEEETTSFAPQTPLLMAVPTEDLA